MGGAQRQYQPDGRARPLHHQPQCRRTVLAGGNAWGIHPGHRPLLLRRHVLHRTTTGNPAVISGTALTTDTYSRGRFLELLLERHRELLSYPHQSARTTWPRTRQRRTDEPSDTYNGHD